MRGRTSAGGTIAHDSNPPFRRDPLLPAVALLALAVSAPISRYLTWLGDEGVVLHGAVRILGGETLYRDFFEVLGPGGFLIVAAWMKLVGVGFGSVRVLAICVIAAIAALLYAAARLSSGNRILAALLAVVWLVRAPFENSHHWLTTAASMAAAVGLLLALESAPRGRGAAFTAGLFAGTAATITQSRGALMCAAVLAVLLTTPRARARVLDALAGMAVCPTAMVLYLAARGALAAAFDDAIRFPARHYAGIQAVPFGSFATALDAASVALFPLAFVLAGAVLAIERGATWREPRFRAALALAVVGLLGAYPRPDVAHLSFTLPLACPLFALAATDLLGRLASRARPVVGTVLIGLCLAGVGYAITRRINLIIGPLRAVPTARGLTVRQPSQWTDDFAALVAQVERIPPDDGVFFYPHLSMLPYLTARRHVAALDVMTPGYTTAAQFRETCVRVVSDARWVVMDRSWSDPRKFQYVFPAMRDPDPPEKRGFETALALAFEQVVHSSAFFEFRQRTGSASVVLCDAR